MRSGDAFIVAISHQAIMVVKQMTANSSGPRCAFRAVHTVVGFQFVAACYLCESSAPLAEKPLFQGATARCRWVRVRLGELWWLALVLWGHEEWGQRSDI